MIFFISAGTFLISSLTTILIKKHALKLRLVQPPNHRSSHNRITPHGGGIGIVFGTFFFTACLFYQHIEQTKFYAFTISLGLLIAIKGLIDDIYRISAQLRLLIQALISFVFILAIQRLPTPGFDSIANLPITSTAALLLLASIWWLNLFNFMDGIDGLAASQAIFMLLAAAGLILIRRPELVTSSLWQSMIYLSIATSGFLVFNWPPAKIFMGDVGSNFLAFMLLMIALTTISLHWLNYATWGILACLFVCDATLTLLRRIFTGQQWSDAHRSHAYQRLSRRWKSHKKVTLTAITINLIWLLPLAFLAIHYANWSWAFLILAYLPVISIVWLLGAGKLDNQQ